MAAQPEIAEPPLQVDESTRTRLADAALRLFAAKGYAETTVREIIQAAGVTRPVLYYYFRNKAELFCYLVETEFDRLYREMDAILSRHAGCRERLKALIGLIFEGAQRSPETVQFMLRFFFAPPDEPMRLDSDKLAQERFDRIAGVMADGVERGELHGGNPRALALAFSGVMDLHVMAKARHPNVELTAGLGDGLVDLFLDGAVGASRDRAELRYALEGIYPADPAGVADKENGKRKP
jgi:AcrR family transcriptional regulator